MPRPKGSKNRRQIAATNENLDMKIATISAEVEKLSADLKSKKAELRKLRKAKERELMVEAAKKAEAERAVIYNAIEKSGKSMDEVLAFLQN